MPGQGHYYNPTFINEGGNYHVEGYVTDIITDKTLAWLHSERDNEKPFMLMMHHKAPHREWELYDLEKDPNEMRNVYNDPAYVNVSEDLHKRLLALREKYGDSDELMNSFLPEDLEKEKRRYVHN